MNDSLYIFLVPFIFILMRRTYCPECGTKAPQFTSPSSITWRQRFEGYFQCRKCDAEVNSNGTLRTVPASDAEIAKRMALPVILLVCTMGVAIGYKSMLKARMAEIPPPPAQVSAPTPAPPISQ